MLLRKIGSSYDSNTGVFTVSLNGTYEFAVNFIKGNKTEWFKLQLMKNNRIVSGHAAYDTYSSGSLQAILELEEGDFMSYNHVYQGIFMIIILPCFLVILYD